MGLFSFKRKPTPEPQEVPSILQSDLPEIRLPKLELPEEFAADELSEAPMLVDMPDVSAPIEAAAPVFVAVEDYQAVLDSVNRVKQLLTNAEEQMREMHSIGSQVGKELDAWRAGLEDAERKLGYVDEIIFQAE